MKRTFYPVVFKKIGTRCHWNRCFSIDRNLLSPNTCFTKSGDKYAASARSVKGFDVYNALEACAEHLEQFWGHMYAAGMTLKEENYQIFKDAFEKK
jgi:single-stranded DNA-specific DHH superfamily exonuclease